MTINAIYVSEKPPFPNALWPALLYTQIFRSGELFDFASLFRNRGWTDVWVNGIYAFDHFHTQAHEALGCISGWALLRLGGPEGETICISAGEALLLPAGMGHGNLRQSEDFCIAGAYPYGQSPDIQRGDLGAYPGLLIRARSLPCPEKDPVSDGGGVVTLWQPAK